MQETRKHQETIGKTRCDHVDIDDCNFGKPINAYSKRYKPDVFYGALINHIKEKVNNQYINFYSIFQTCANRLGFNKNLEENNPEHERTKQELIDLRNNVEQYKKDITRLTRLMQEQTLKTVKEKQNTRMYKARYDEMYNKYSELLTQRQANRLQLTEEEFTTVLNTKTAYNHSQVEFIKDLLNGEKWFKFLNSVILAYSSKNDIFEFLSDKGVSSNRSFIYNPTEYAFVKKLVDIETTFWKSQPVLIVHYDNNDLKIKYGKKGTYIACTSYSVFIPRENVENFEKLNEFRPRPALNNIDAVIRTIMYLSNEEKQMRDKELEFVFDCMTQKKYDELFSFFGKKKRKRKPFKVKKSDLSDQRTLETKF